MKSTLFTLAFFFIFCLSSFEHDTPANFFTVGNNKHSLDFSEIVNESYGIKSKFEVDLINQVEDLAKAKTYLYFSLASNNTASLSNGIYQFSSTALNDRLPFQFNGSIKINNHKLEITEGTISIEKCNRDYDIQFILKLQNGDIAKGTYRDKVLEVDRSRAYN